MSAQTVAANNTTGGKFTAKDGSGESSFITNHLRPIMFVLIALVHAAIIFFVAFSVKTAPQAGIEPGPLVMKLTDFSVYTPPPPKAKLPDENMQNTVEAVAENMIETDVAPNETVITQPVYSEGDNDYLPMHRISVLPVFSERDIMRDIVYPPIALRSGIEGIVYLELFIDKEGVVRRVTVLRENPPDRGFGEAAVNAFTNRRGEPARANGEAAAVRYRYQLRFQIK
jgi:protein TonB